MTISKLLSEIKQSKGHFFGFDTRFLRYFNCLVAICYSHSQNFWFEVRECALRKLVNKFLTITNMAQTQGV